MWIYALSVALSFTSVFFKGWQHKNVIGNHQVSMFITSYLMAVFDVATIKIVFETGSWWVAASAGTGAAFGMIASTNLHNWVYRKLTPEEEIGIAQRKLDMAALDTLAADLKIAKDERIDALISDVKHMPDLTSVSHDLNALMERLHALKRVMDRSEVSKNGL